MLGAATANDDVYGITFPFVLEDQPFAVPAPGVLGNDSAGPGETPCVVAPPTTTTQGGTVSLAADGSFTYTPPVDYAGADSFTYGVAATIGDLCPPLTQDTAVVTLTVTQVNDAPTLELVGACAGGVTVAEDAGGYLGEAVCVALHPGPENESGQELAALSLETSGDVGFETGPSITLEGFLAFRPAANDSGTATVSIQGRDNGGTANGGADLSQPVVLTITVTPVPDAPVALADTFAVLKDRTLNIAAPGVLANDYDVDGSTVLSAVLGSPPVHGVVTLASNGSFSYSPAAGYIGPDAFSYRATDGGLSSATRIVSLTVSAIPVPTPTPAVSAPPSAVPSLGPSAEVTPEPTLEELPTLEPGATPGPSVATSSAPGPGATPEPEPATGSRGLSLPLLLAAVLFGVLLVFAGVYYVPRWINARQGERLD